MALTSTIEGVGEFLHEVPAAGTVLDTAQHPVSVGGQALPLLAGVDTRYDGVWRRLAGFRRISQTAGNSRLKGSEVGLADSAAITVDFFKPIVVKYGSEPHERRGFVMSANNRLVFKYYDTKTAAWAVRTLVSDLDTQFGTRTDFDVSAQGKFMYISRSGLAATNLGTTKTPMVVWWEQERWYNIGPGVVDGDGSSVEVRTMAIFRGELHIGGTFTTISGRTIRGIAKWNGAYWEEVGGGVGGTVSVNTLYARTDGVQQLWVGGAFTTVDPSGVNLTVNRAAIWDGSVWSQWDAANPGFANGVVNMIRQATVNNGAGAVTVPIFVGTFTTLTRAATVANRIAYYDGTNLQQTDATGLAAEARACHDSPFAEDYVYVTGDFASAGGVANTPIIAKWGGTAVGWAAVGRGLSGGSTAGWAFAAWNNKLYVGGIFTTATQSGGGTVAVSNLAEWDNTNWADVGGGTNGRVAALAVVTIQGGTALVAGGNFSAVGVGGATPATNVAQWNGSTWNDMLDGLTGNSALAPDVRVLLREDLDGVIGSVLAGGSFPTTAGSPTLAVNGVARWISGGEFEASVGARHWSQFSPPLLSTTVTPVTGTATEEAQFAADAKYAVMITLCHQERGMETPISNIVTFEVTAGTETQFRKLTPSILAGLRSVSQPRTLRVWRSLGQLTSLGGDPVNGPFYLESELMYDPDAGTPVDFLVGRLADVALGENEPYTTTAHDPGSHSEGVALAAYKHMLFTLAGDWKPAGALAGTEAYFDIRWSPPWQTTPEFSTRAGFYRTQSTAGELPRFIEVGDLLVFACRAHLVRLAVQGDYLIPADGPTGYGICNREAMAAVGGDLWFITAGGEFVQMNVASGQWQINLAFTRVLKTRWKVHVANGRMNVVYDDLSNMLLVFPRQANADAATPVEGMVMHLGTGEPSWVNDLFFKWGQSGLDPETGRRVAFVVTHTGVILSPDWQERGAWAAHGTWGTNHFYTNLGLTGTVKGIPTNITDLGGGNSFRITCGAAAFDIDTAFPLLVYATCYISRQHPTDSSRRQLVAALTITAQSSATVFDVSATGGHNRMFGGLSLTNWASWTAVRVHIAPMPFQVGLEVPRSRTEVSLFDRGAVHKLGVTVGQLGDGSKTTVDPETDFFAAGTAVLDETNWRLDHTNASSAGAILPFTTVATEVMADTAPLSVDPDNMWMDVPNPPGHFVIPILSAFVPDLLFEVLGVGAVTIIDKTAAGVNAAD